MESGNYEYEKIDLAALRALGQITVGLKTNNKDFIARCVAIEENHIVFQTKSGEFIRNTKESLVSIKPIHQKIPIETYAPTNDEV